MLANGFFCISKDGRIWCRRISFSTQPAPLKIPRVNFFRQRIRDCAFIGDGFMEWIMNSNLGLCNIIKHRFDENMVRFIPRRIKAHIGNIIGGAIHQWWCVGDGLIHKGIAVQFISCEVHDMNRIGIRLTTYPYP